MNQIINALLPGTQIDPRYPESDGRPMGDTEYHYIAMTTLHDSLKDYFADRPDLYVACNLIFYWKLGDPKSRRDPDVLVAKGVAGNHIRRSFRLWEEKKLPCTLFEIASRKTWRKDLYEKPELYASVGVKEYFIFDPEGKYLKPMFQGFRCVKRKPAPMKPAADGSLASKELNLRFIPEGVVLRPFDQATGQPILTREERLDQAEQDRQRAEALAAEVERLRRRLEKNER